MKKTIFIVLISFFLIVIAFLSYIALTTRSHSPFDKATFTSNNLSLEVTYCQPYKKGRLLFGNKEEGALVPYGFYWRMGANDATEISFDQDVTFAGQPLPKGKYRMYAVPQKDRWEVTLNSELGQFGYFTPNYELDVLKVEVPVQISTEFYEQLTMKFAERDEMLFLAINWDMIMVEIPIEVQN